MHCDEVFRAPAPEPEAAVDPPAAPAETTTEEQPAPAAPAAKSAPAGGGVTVRRADGITVKRAKPKAPAKKTSDTPKGGGRPATAPAQLEPTKRAAPARGPGGKFAAKAGSTPPPSPPPRSPQRGGGVGYYLRKARRAG